MPYSEANSRLMLIDDRDPAVQYENSWDRETVFGNSISTSSTSNASVSMEFDGTRIIVVALAAPANSTAPPTVQFAIDGAPVDTITPPAAEDWTFYAIFDSQGLADGMHTINATVLDASEEYPLMLDAFMFQPSKKYWGLALAPSTLEVDGKNADAGAGASRKVDVGAIVGGVLGGLALVAVGIALFWWWRRKRQHVYTSLGGEGNYNERKSSKTVTPFMSMQSPPMFCAEDKRAYCDPSNTPSMSPVPPEYPNTAATATSSSSAVAHAHLTATLETAPADSMLRLEARPTEASIPAVRKVRRTSIAGIMQAAIQATRWRASRREDVPPSEAPPRYSER